MTPEGEIAPEARKTGRGWVDLSVAVCALIVSVTSLSIAFRHGHTMERMADANARLVSANSYPLLQQSQSSAPDLKSADYTLRAARVASLNVRNTGVGPAKVETLEVFWSDHPVRTAHELLRACCATSEDADLVSHVGTEDLQGSMLLAGEWRRLLVIPGDGETKALAARFQDAYPKVEMRACYCSVFDECWLSNLETLHPQSVTSCPKPAVPFAPPGTP
jgi:hypothetical protein